MREKRIIEGAGYREGIREQATNYTFQNNQLDVAVLLDFCADAMMRIHCAFHNALV